MPNSKDYSVLQMTVNLRDDETVSLDLSSDMIINVANINESYINQPARYAYWATLATLARSKANKLKSQIDKEQDYLKTVLTGTLDGKVRTQLELDGEKVTETKVTNAIFTHPEYISCKMKISELQDKFIEADEQARLLEVGRETMNQRKEMLISLGAQLRTDFDSSSDLYIKDGSVTNIRDIVGKKRSQRAVERMERKPIVSDEEDEE